MTEGAVSAAEFAALMAPLGPFEAAPELAVAVSGGADSLALLLLAGDWSQARGGRVAALTVDHRLRPESAAEAARLGVWLAARGVPHHILPWSETESEATSGDPCGRGLQARARAARYRLLTDWCRRRHCLHLLLGHHQDDQAETLMQRLQRGSGVDGLAAMSGQSFRAPLQLLRPLLPVPHLRLAATLQALGQDWIEDPSNRQPRFNRVRWRQRLQDGAIDSRRLADTALQMGRARQALEAATAALAVDCVVLDAAGHAWLAPLTIAAAADEMALRLLATLCRVVGGDAFPPRLASLERLLGWLRQGAPRRRTLAGCVFASQGDRLLVYRESRALAPPRPLPSGQAVLWDQRFTVRASADRPLWLGALGRNPPTPLPALARQRRLAAALLPSLPAIMDKHGILAVPPLGYQAADNGLVVEAWGFTPHTPLVGASFYLVPKPTSPI